MRQIALCILALTLSLVVTDSYGSITFDGDAVAIPDSAWLLLENVSEDAFHRDVFSPEQLARDLDTHQWGGISSAESGMQGDGLKILRLELIVDYDGPQKPLLLIPYAFVPQLTIGVFDGHDVLMWQSLEEGLALSGLGTKMARPTGMIKLPIDKPGRYQLLIKGSSVANFVVLRGARLYLDQEYILREYPSRVSVASGVLGALSTYIICCVALMAYRFRFDLLYAIFFLGGSFFVLYLREGVVFLDFDLDVTWWVMRVLPAMMGIAHFGLLFFVSYDLRDFGWHRCRSVLYACGTVSLLVGLLNLFFPSREHLIIGVPGLIATFLGFLLALVILLARAISGSIRDRLFTLFVGSFFVVMLYRAAITIMSSSISVPITSLYVATNLVGIFIFVEYLISSAREYLDKKAQQSADLTRVDLVNRFSHELRTPLNAVIGLADLMRGSKDLKKIDNYAGMIQAAGKTLLDLVSDILDFSKLGNKGITLEEQRMRLDELLTEVMMSFLPQVSSTGVVPGTDIEPGVPFYLIGDDLRMKQIFSNLLSNSIKFSPPGKPVSLTIRKGAEIGDRVELRCSVRDEGRGIPPDMLESIFEPYTQAKAEDGGHLRGTGLGLAICKLLIEQMQGEVKVESELGVGTTFYFNLWLKRDPKAPDLDEQFASLKDKQALFVSRHPTVTGMMKNFFQHWGSTVTVASTCAEAPEQFYDIVLVDSTIQSAVENIDWLERQPANTLIEISQLKPEPWVATLKHPNVHDIQLPIALLDIIAQIVEDLSGTTLSIGKKTTEMLQPSFADHHVLLVDDNQVNLTVASKLLETMGVQCETADSGQLALQLLRDDRSYTMVLLDCEMPDMNGFEVCRYWRDYERQQHLPRLPVVALTAHALNEVREECYSAGMDEVLYKPIGKAVLSEALTRFSKTAIEHSLQ